MPELPPALVLLAGAMVLPLLPARLRSLAFVALPVATGLAVWQLELGTSTTFTFYGLELEPLRVDRLSRVFAYVFVLAAVLSTVYGLRVTGTGERVAALAYAGSALGIVFAGDLLTLFVFWELKVVTSVFLVWARRSPQANAAGQRYLFVHLTGGVVLLAGILWWYARTGSLTFDAFDMGGPGALVLLSFLLTAAVPPLHAWLCDAYPEATVPGTVFLSAFTTKAAVYALARGFPGVELLVWAGVAMALYGVVYAVLENDIRRLLAYHIISQVGYMVAAVGIGTEAAINGATAHAFAHILYKGLLLMGAGAVLHATGRSKLTELGGLARAMPWVLGLYLVGAASISAFPLFSGFVSKEVVVHAASLDGRAAVVWLLKLASIGTFLHTGLKLPWFTWLGPRRPITVGPVPASMYVAMALLAVLNLAIGVAPGALYDLLPHPVDYTPYTLARVADMVNLLFFTAVGFWLLRGRLGGEPTLSVDTDWFYREAPERVAVAVRRGPAGRLQPGDVAARVRRAVGIGGPLGYGAPRSRRRAGAGGHAGPTWALGAVVLATFVLTLVVSLLS